MHIEQKLSPSSYATFCLPINHRSDILISDTVMTFFIFAGKRGSPAGTNPVHYNANMFKFFSKTDDNEVP